jgi:type VI secretion system secreted protein VgrG
MIGAITQFGRLLHLDTPLGGDVLLPRSFTATEGLSTLFHYHLVLASENTDIDFDQLVGKPATLSVRHSDGVSQRYFNGYISRFVQKQELGRLATYEAELVPWLWFLTLTADCRIYQWKTVPEVIDDTFQRYSFSDYRMDLVMSHTPWEYCTQYRESAFAFVSRLMEIEGMYYYFEQQDGEHTLVITDHRSTHKPCPYQSDFRYEKVIGEGYRHTDDTIYKWIPEKKVRPGKYTHRDYNFEKPDDLLQAQMTEIAEETSENWGEDDEDRENPEYEIYDYPGEYEDRMDADDWARLRIEEQETDHDVADGDSNCRSMLPGFKFTMQDHFRQDQNREYLLTKVVHSGQEGTIFGGTDEGEAHYENQFSCMPADVQYRVRKTKHHQMLGSQTAFVVGPPGEEIHTDQYGRVRVKFHWDRRPGRPEDSSCWIRVMHQWTGTNWGHQWIPRIGQEVIVDFLEGDPDRPIITGCVYNQDNMVPWTLPDNKTVSGFKTHSSKGGGADNFNQIRFEDKKGEELLSIQAEKDRYILVKHDDTEHVQHDQTINIDHDQTQTIGHDQTEEVKHDQKLTVDHDRTEEVKNDETITIDHDQSLTVKNDRSKKIDGDQKLRVKGDQSEMVEGDQKRTVKGDESEQVKGDFSLSVDGDHTVSIKGDKHLSVTGESSSKITGKRTAQIEDDDQLKVQGDLTIEVQGDVHIKVGGTMLVKAGDEITLKGPGGFVTIDSKGVTIQGKKVFINCGGSASDPESPDAQDPNQPQSFDGDPFASDAPAQEEGLSAGPMGSLGDTTSGGTFTDSGVDSGALQGSVTDNAPADPGMLQGSVTDNAPADPGMLQGSVTDNVPADPGMLQGNVTDNVPADPGMLQGSVTENVPADPGLLQGNVTQDVLQTGISQDAFPPGEGGPGPGAGTPGGSGGVPGTGTPGTHYLKGYVQETGPPPGGPFTPNLVVTGPEAKGGVGQEIGEEKPKLGASLQYVGVTGAAQQVGDKTLNVQAAAYSASLSSGITKEDGGYSANLIKGQIGLSAVKVQGEQELFGGAASTKESLDIMHADASANIGVTDSATAHQAKAELSAEIDLAKANIGGEIPIPIPFTNQVLTLGGELEGSVGAGAKASIEDGWTKEEGYQAGAKFKAAAGLGFGAAFKLGLKEREEKRGD